MKTKLTAKPEPQPTTLHQSPSLSTHAESRGLEDPVSLRKGSEPIYTNSSKTPKLYTKSEVYDQGVDWFKHKHDNANDRTVVIAARRRLYSHYDRINHENFIASKNSSDDYLAKYKTEKCKNFEFTGNCQWGDAVG